jgi:transcriptional regulator with XRE-family HTH domain
MSIHRLIRERRLALGLSEKELADLVGVSRSAVQQWEREEGEEGSTSPRPKLRPKLAEALGISVYDLTAAESHQPISGVAQSMSQSPFDTPSLLRWEEVVERTKLPAEFRMQMPDDALAPAYGRGLEIVWSTEKAPAIGSLVIVRDKHGQTHVRQYAQGNSPGHWIAAATPPFYSFDSNKDGLTVMAVAKWRPMP